MAVTPEPAETRYAKAPDGAHLAYQIVGDGPIDLLELPGTLMSIDAVGDQPIWLRFQERLASFCRLIRVDLRGIGLSDLDASTPPTVERWMDDALAVLDAAGSERTALWGAGFGGAMALLLAASHPDRVSALILINAFARLVRAPDYEPGVPAALLADFQESLVDPAQEPVVDDVDLIAPSLAGDPEFRAWWRRTGNRGASPATAVRCTARLMAARLARHTLPSIQAPMLVIHRAGNNSAKGGAGTLVLAAQATAADGPLRRAARCRPRRLPGRLGRDRRRERGSPSSAWRRRRRSGVSSRSVPFSDIVSSTERAAAIGDGEWRHVLDGHDDMVRRLLRRYSGLEVKATGDGFMATFDGPAEAPFSARLRSATVPGSSVSTCGSGCTAARSSSAAPTSAASRCTSPNGSSRSRSPARCSCRAR